ncbi:MAG: hypothetical protein SPG28_00885 [Alloprevotella sp.]|nr:hypothetical protein [Alloprevotella sp.]
MMQHLKKSYILFALALLSIAAQAQTNGSNSPYSRYGFGLLGDGAGAFNKGMSGLAYGMRNGKELNTQNPASYSAIDSLTFLFDFGASFQNANLDAGGQKLNAKNTSVDYVTMGFRVAPKLGLALGLRPFSTIGYKVTSYSSFTSMEGAGVTQTQTFQGDGGLHEAFLGLGWSPVKNLSLGANIGYLWGNLYHTVYSEYSDASINKVQQIYDTDMRTFKADFGLQYEYRLHRNHTLTFGATYGLGHNLRSDAFYYNQNIASNSSTATDTLVASHGYDLPHTFGAGLAWDYKGRLRVGFDYTMKLWSKAKSPMLMTDEYGQQHYVSQTGAYDDQQVFTVGAEYVPEPEGLKKRKKIRYRAGFSYSTPYAKVNGQKGPADYCASVGAAFPIINTHNNRTFLNLAFQYEHAQPKSPGMIKENYLRVSIGITFNERWFMKWKAE